MVASIYVYKRSHTQIFPSPTYQPINLPPYVRIHRGASTRRAASPILAHGGVVARAQIRVQLPGFYRLARTDRKDIRLRESPSVPCFATSASFLSHSPRRENSWLLFFSPPPLTYSPIPISDFTAAIRRDEEGKTAGTRVRRTIKLSSGNNWKSLSRFFAFRGLARIKRSERE